MILPQYLKNFKVLKKKKFMAKDLKITGVENELFVLPKRKVYIKPVIWMSNWVSMLGGKGHSIAWKNDNTKVTFLIPIDSNTNALVEPLTIAERKYFESERCPLGFKTGDLLANQFVTDTRQNKILKSYWTKATFTINKSKGVIDEDTILATLDLNNPKDYLSYAILRANVGTLVAPDAERRYHNGRYLIYLVDEGEDDAIRATKADRIAEAYAHFTTISNQSFKMRELLTVAYLDNKSKIRPSDDASQEWLKSECNKLIQHDYGKTYLDVIKNNFEGKAFLFKCLEAGAIKLRRDGLATNDGTWLGANLDQSVRYLADPKNQEMMLKLQGQLDRK